MHRLTYALLLVAPVAFAQAAAPADDIPDWVLGVLTTIAGIVIMVFAGARARQQAERLGSLVDTDKTANGATYLYLGMGALLAIAGVLVTIGVINPA